MTSKSEPKEYKLLKEMYNKNEIETVTKCLSAKKRKARTGQIYSEIVLHLCRINTNVSQTSTLNRKERNSIKLSL
jgi:hypothetical protein